jgi:hypothetical protein
LQVGQQQSFRYQVTNLGPNTATAVVVTLERLYPDNCVGVIFCDGEVRFKEVTTEQGQCVFGEDQLTCHLNNLAAHAETTISGTVEAVYPGTIDYYFTANASQTDPNSTNNTNISSRFYVYPDYANSQCRDYTSENWAHRREHRAISCGDNLCTTGDTFEFEPDTQESTLYMGNDALSYHSLANCELANFGELGETAARIFTASDLPNSENIAFTEDGRQFVALATSSNSRIVEVTQSDSGYQATTLQTGQGCMFSGLTAKNNMLYAGCSVGTSNTGSVKLYQIDPDDPDRYSPIELDKTMVSYANGMTLDNQGNLLISNSFANSFFGSKPSIVKVELAGGDNFVATHSTTPMPAIFTPLKFLPLPEPQEPLPRSIPWGANTGLMILPLGRIIWPFHESATLTTTLGQMGWSLLWIKTAIPKSKPFFLRVASTNQAAWLFQEGCHLDTAIFLSATIIMGDFISFHANKTTRKNLHALPERIERSHMNGAHISHF